MLVTASSTNLPGAGSSLFKTTAVARCAVSGAGNPAFSQSDTPASRRT